MDRVGGNTKVSGDGEFGAVVEYTTNDLQFTTRKVERISDSSPSPLSENPRTGPSRWPRFEVGREIVVAATVALIQFA